MSRRDAGETLHIYRHPDPRFLVVWYRGGIGKPWPTDGINCSCDAARFAIGCRHVKAIHDLGGIEGAREYAKEEWTPELQAEANEKDGVQGTLGVGEPQNQPELQQHGPHVRGDSAVGAGGRSAIGGTGAAAVVQGQDTGRIQETQRGGNQMSSHGYDYEPPKSGGGNYLRLSKDGESLRLRLVSAPHIFTEEVTWGDKTQTKTNAAWIVLHRTSEDGKAISVPRTFKAGMTVYAQIRDLDMDPDWGDPTGYDIVVTRTGTGLETKYGVIPKPNGKPVTAEERAAIDDANFDLRAMYEAKNGQRTSNDAPPHSDSDDPWADD